MTLCPECSEPLDDFSPCACAFGQVRSKSAKPAGKPQGAGGMRQMVARKLERKLRHRAIAAADVVITVKDPLP